MKGGVYLCGRGSDLAKRTEDAAAALIAVYWSVNLRWILQQLSEVLSRTECKKVAHLIYLQLISCHLHNRWFRIYSGRIGRAFQTPIWSPPLRVLHIPCQMRRILTSNSFRFPHYKTALWICLTLNATLFAFHAKIYGKPGKFNNRESWGRMWIFRVG